MKELTFYLGYEATASLEVLARSVQTPMSAHTGVRLSQDLALVPILRAGLGMLDSMLTVLPKAKVHHLGLYHKRDHDLPVLYYNKLPESVDSDIAFVLEPMVATAVTIMAVLDILKAWGVKKIVVISVLGSKAGIEKIASRFPDVDVFVAAVDEKLTKENMISPGLGDVGNRLFSGEVGAAAATSSSSSSGGEGSNGVKRLRSE